MISYQAGKDEDRTTWKVKRGEDGIAGTGRLHLRDLTAD